MIESANGFVSRGSHRGHVAHGSVVLSVRAESSRRQAHGDSSASNQYGAGRHKVGTAHRHVAALLFFTIALLCASFKSGARGTPSQRAVCSTC
jgi:hypothetical protein